MAGNFASIYYRGESLPVMRLFSTHRARPTWDNWGRDGGSVTLSAKYFFGKAIATWTCRGSHRTLGYRATPLLPPYSSFTAGQYSVGQYGT